MLQEGEIPAESVPPCLTTLGLVRTGHDDPATVEPVPPHAAAFAVFQPLQEELAAQRRRQRVLMAAFSLVEEVYLDARRDEQPQLTLLRGAADINNALEAAVDACQEELLTAQPGGGRSTDDLALALERDMRRLARGRRQQTLYQHTVRHHQPTLAYISQIARAGAEVRTLAEVFDRLIICDRTVAFIPVSDDRGTAALEVRHPAVVRFLARSFDRDWTRSIPVEDPDSGLRPRVVVSDIQRTILHAVVSGETDESIARRLGMSRRSVAEHVRKVSEQLGSGSRAQLGYLLATSDFPLDAPGGGMAAS
ncbi:LuxR C-terminal-related transcriptional regulator [Streptomyces sp. 8N706]|uniref:LuxR C-terminal-related transcriptional regulator n=1 Tax=Streptomyces sp. 8N706 TaxID=3457416 RepID=UPI003FD4A8F2